MRKASDAPRKDLLDLRCPRCLEPLWAHRCGWKTQLSEVLVLTTEGGRALDRRLAESREAREAFLASHPELDRRPKKKAPRQSFRVQGKDAVRQGRV